MIYHDLKIRYKIFRIVNKEKGFTVIELMIASIVFAVVLIILTFGVVNISRTYYKGVTITNTQNVLRNIVTDISQNIEFSGGQVGQAELTSDAQVGQTQVFCIGNRAYYYQLGDEVEPTPTTSDQAVHGLVVVPNVTTCPLTSAGNVDLKTGANIPSGGEEMLSSNMRLSVLKVIPDPSGIPGLYEIDVQVTYGASDLLNNPLNVNDLPVNNNPTPTTCIGGVAEQFCATAELNTSIAMRVD